MTSFTAVQALLCGQAIRDTVRIHSLMSELWSENYKRYIIQHGSRHCTTVYCIFICNVSNIKEVTVNTLQNLDLLPLKETALAFDIYLE